MRVTPSITESGYPVKVIGTAKEPAELNELQATELLQHLNHICIDNGVEYLQKGKNTNNNSFLTPELKRVVNSLDVSFASKDTVKIPSGYRNVTLISVANSILSTHLDKDRANEERLKDFFMAINSFLCKPEPLPTKEAEAIWASALKWMYPKIINEELHGTRKGAKTKDEQQKKEKEEEDERERIEDLLDKLISKYHFKTVSNEDDDILYWNLDRGIYLEGGFTIIQSNLEADYLKRLAEVAEAA